MNMSHTFDFYSESEIRDRELRTRARKRLRESLRIAEAEWKDFIETVAETPDPSNYYENKEL